jgi:hypothetical protein
MVQLDKALKAKIPKTIVFFITYPFDRSFAEFETKGFIFSIHRLDEATFNLVQSKLAEVEPLAFHRELGQ